MSTEAAPRDGWVPNVRAAVHAWLRRLLAAESAAELQLREVLEGIRTAVPAEGADLRPEAFGTVREAWWALDGGERERARDALVVARGRLVRSVAVAERTGQLTAGSGRIPRGGCSRMSTGSEGGSHGQVRSR